ncbi:tripartite tricarboxylate transporter substrate binding protein [Candidimonas humi]|uniref:Bug family tripartite tricarboxylate transporter substrate binding protein n=1 Tax=Candidimonas humi TaxID=683355 RepID=A0ABV8NUV9_9BURK|nr:tripartite tricarboxylate transporter substrate binding protein [Candidimonas humi]MBV6304802.1 tripartite tricarboxylate transporter substrate binding protein [Candidimonas humi]
MSESHFDTPVRFAAGRRRALQHLTALGLFASGGLPAASLAQNYPSRPVRLMVGFSPGAATDAFARIVAKRLSAMLGQQFIVDNRPGAATRIAMDDVQKSTADGYMLGFATAVTAAFPLLFKGLSFDPGRNFTPVAMLGRAPMFLVVRSNLGVNTYQEFVNYARKKGSLAFGHQGKGSNPHLAGLALAKSAGFHVVDVPYRGGGPLSLALGAGEVDFAMIEYAGVRPMLERGAVKLLLVTEPDRSPNQPKVPAGREVGMPADAEGLAPWFMLIAPPGTPESTVKVLGSSVKKLLALPDVHKELLGIGIVPHYADTKETAKFFLSQRKRIVTLAHDLNLSLSTS